MIWATNQGLAQLDSLKDYLEIIFYSLFSIYFDFVQ